MRHLLSDPCVHTRGSSEGRLRPHKVGGDWCRFWLGFKVSPMIASLRFYLRVLDCSERRTVSVQWVFYGVYHFLFTDTLYAISASNILRYHYWLGDRLSLEEKTQSQMMRGCAWNDTMRWPDAWSFLILDTRLDVLILSSIKGHKCINATIFSQTVTPPFSVLDPITHLKQIITLAVQTCLMNLHGLRCSINVYLCRLLVKQQVV